MKQESKIHSNGTKDTTYVQRYKKVLSQYRPTGKSNFNMELSLQTNIERVEREINQLQIFKQKNAHIQHIKLINFDLLTYKRKYLETLKQRMRTQIKESTDLELIRLEHVIQELHNRRKKIPRRHTRESIQLTHDINFFIDRKRRKTSLLKTIINSCIPTLVQID